MTLNFNIQKPFLCAPKRPSPLLDRPFPESFSSFEFRHPTKEMQHLSNVCFSGLMIRQLSRAISLVSSLLRRHFGSVHTTYITLCINVTIKKHYHCHITTTYHIISRIFKTWSPFSIRWCHQVSRSEPPITTRTSVQFRNCAAVMDRKRICKGFLCCAVFCEANCWAENDKKKVKKHQRRVLGTIWCETFAFPICINVLNFSRAIFPNELITHWKDQPRTEWTTLPVPNNKLLKASQANRG